MFGVTMKSYKIGNTVGVKAFVLVSFVACFLTGCYVPKYRAYRNSLGAEAVHNQRSATVATVYVYPAHGQSDTQLDRDRYECNAWAVKQSGYDPSQLHLDTEEVSVVAGPPPGTSTAAGAITGAVLGAAVSRPRQAGGGAIIGGIAGAMIGAAADSAQEEQEEKIQQEYAKRSDAALEKAEGYKRAIIACLESRDYTVR